MVEKHSDFKGIGLRYYDNEVAGYKVKYQCDFCNSERNIIAWHVTAEDDPYCGGDTRICIKCLNELVKLVPKLFSI